MYGIALLLHNYTRWIVLAALAWALYRAWSRWIRSREWSAQAQQAGLLLTVLATVQFIFGLVLLIHPAGLGRAALSIRHIQLGKQHLTRPHFCLRRILAPLRKLFPIPLNLWR